MIKSFIRKESVVALTVFLIASSAISSVGISNDGTNVIKLPTTMKYVPGECIIKFNKKEGEKI